MSKHEADNQDMPGYFLPEDSQFRLMKLRGHMEFLSHLAQPRAADEASEWMPEIRTGEVAVCLELLAEQADLVLADMSWLPSRQSVASTAEDDDEQEHGDEDEDGHEGEHDAAPEVSDATGRPLVFGLTVAQVDALDRLVQTISAHGDVLAMSDPDDLADGTVPTLGQAIHDAAVEVRELLDQLGAQRLVPLPRPRSGVREERTAYAAELAPSAPVLPVPPHRLPAYTGQAGQSRLH